MRNIRSNPAQRRDHYQELTDKIIAALDSGTAPWRRPWDKAACGGATAPVNAATGHRYRGINLFVLGMSPLAFASDDPRWCSYRQAAARGWQVRKGEKATPVYFYKPIEIEDKTSDGERETRRIPILRTFSVFHASQIDGIPELAPAVATKAVAERIEDVEIIVQTSGVPVRIGGIGRSTAQHSTSSRCLRTKRFTARNCAQQRFAMNYVSSQLSLLVAWDFVRGRLDHGLAGSGISTPASPPRSSPRSRLERTITACRGIITAPRQRGR